MSNRALDFFSTVKTEGAMLPPEILVRIAQMDAEMGGLTPDAYHLDKGEKVNEAINRSWNRLLGVWGTFRKAQEVLLQEDSGTSLTREKWLLKLFDELGYGRLLPSKPFDVEGKIYPVSHFWQHTPIHLIGFRTDLDKHVAHYTGAYRYKPHSMVQEFLNRTEGHLWAFLSNGLQLRILRDNTSFVRQAYVEFDLEAMMDGGIFPDFKLLWLLCHQSRVEADRPEDCWLENWTRVTQVVGTRAREDLRNGVQRAIEALGAGFLAHPTNDSLREELRTGHLDKQDYYRELLRFVYQLIFLFVAEDRDLLAPPSTTPEAKNRYIRYYSTARLRLLAGRKAGTRHDDLYRVTRLVIGSLGEGEGRKELGIPILNSSLFSTTATPSLRKSLIANMDYLEAIRALAITSDRYGRRPTDFRNLGSEELGSIYESLLELHPYVNIEAKTFSLKTAAGNERKTTGSYYTPTSLISCLLDSALDPVLDEAEGKVNPEKAILDLKVCDPACGSGHFLIAAAHRMAGRLASIRAGGEEPPPDIYRRGLRDVIGRCVYGVDINPMAVELCKVSLWMEALEPGKPLSFLDHHIRAGNSLLGATPELIAAGLPDDAFTPIEGDDKKACAVLKKRNKAEGKGLGPLFAQQEAETQARLQQAAAALAELPDDRPEEIRAKELAFRLHEQTQEYRHKKQLADAWCAAFVIRKYFRETGREASAKGITQGHLNELAVGRPLPADLAGEVEHLSSQYQFFHWYLAFPEVFAKGGFDCVLGNPPWDVFQPEEEKFFTLIEPSVLAGKTASERKRRIQRLETEQPNIWQRWTDYAQIILRSRSFMGASGRFPFTSYGKTNLYSSFAEAGFLLVSPTGHVGIVVPTGIATDEPNKHFMQALFSGNRLVSLFDFENKQVFPAVDSRFKFCLLTMTGAQSTSKLATFAFFIHSVEQLREPGRLFRLSAEDVAILNPNTKTCPIFRGAHDAELTKAVYKRVPSFQVEGREDGDPWSVQLARLFMMDSDSGCFVTADAATDGGYFRRLYESKLIHQFDHRYATFEGVGVEGLRGGQAEELSDRSPTNLVVSRFYVPTEITELRYQRAGWTASWGLSLRDITNATNERTTITCIVPREAAANNLPLILSPRAAPEVACLCGNLNSFCLDYVSRQKVGGMHINLYLLQQFPVLAPSLYGQTCVWSFNARTLSDWLLPRVLELTYTAWDLEPFARDCGLSGPPFRWDEERRFLLRCELDAAFFRFYLQAEKNGDWRPSEGETAEDLAQLQVSFPIPRDAVAYIMDTFPIVRRKDEAKYGTYRTKDTILEIYDVMTDAIQTGKPYQTRLEPPAADPRCCHPARERSSR